MKQKLHSDEDLERFKKNDKFHRDKLWQDTILKMQCGTLKILPWLLVLLFILALTQPAFIKNQELLNRVMWALGGSVLTTLLSKVKKHED